MSSKNKVTLVGNVGSEPVIDEDRHGEFARLSLATNDNDLDGENNPQWHTIIAYKDSQFIRKKIHKGDYVEIQGRLMPGFGSNPVKIIEADTVRRLSGSKKRLENKGEYDDLDSKENIILCDNRKETRRVG